MIKKSQSLNLPANPLKIVVAQMRSGEEPTENLEFIYRTLEKHKESKSEVFCFPENSLFFRLSSQSKMINFDLTEDFWPKLKDSCEKYNTKILLGSAPLKVGTESYNATVLVTKNEVKEVYRKTHLFDVDVEGEKPQRESDQFRHGEGPKTLTFENWVWGLSVCYDLRFPELYLPYAKMGVHVLFVPSAFLRPTGQAHWHTLLRARAIESQAYVVAPAQSGGHEGPSGAKRDTYGHSLVVDSWGKVILDMETEGEGSFEVTLDPKLIEKTRIQIPMASHRRLS